MLVTSPPVTAPPPWARATRLLPVTVDLAVVGAVGLVALFDLITVANRFDYFRLWLALVPIGLAATRRWAALPAIALLAAGTLHMATFAHVVSGDPGIPPMAPIAAIVALTPTAVRRRPVPWAITAGAIGFAAVGAVATWPMEPAPQVLLAVASLGSWSAAVGGGAYLRHLDDARVRAADDARRSERLDLARELHDLVAHYVTGIVVQAQAAQVMADRDPAAAGTALERIEGAGRDALGAMRTMVGSLRGAEDEAPTVPPAGLAPLDGLAGLEDLADRSRATGLPVTVTVAPDATRAARGAVATSVHRIVQESLTNVHRHAVDPTGARVDVGLAGGHLVVTVTDDGRQPVGPADRTITDRTLVGAGFGILGMTERAHALAGTLTAGAVAPPGHGWRVQAALPVDPQAQPQPQPQPRR